MSAVHHETSRGTKIPHVEVGYLVKRGVDFLPIVTWAKSQTLMPLTENTTLKGAMGSLPITVDGNAARVGWIKPGAREEWITPPYVVEHPGGEEMFIVCGGLTAYVKSRNDTEARSVHMPPKGHRPNILQLDAHDWVQFELLEPQDQDKACWFVSFYPTPSLSEEETEQILNPALSRAAREHFHET